MASKRTACWALLCWTLRVYSAQLFMTVCNTSWSIACIVGSSRDACSIIGESKKVIMTDLEGGSTGVDEEVLPVAKVKELYNRSKWQSIRVR